MSSMTLGPLIERLKKEDPNLAMPVGFGAPMSYRGIYEDVAFEPVEDTTIGEMLAHAESALGTTFIGYKGGDFTMKEYTDCWIAIYGVGGGDQIGALFMNSLIENAKNTNEQIQKAQKEVEGMRQFIIAPEVDLPMQPIDWDDQGVLRFRQNKIVCWLLHAGPFDMNQIAVLPGISREEREQFAQLIGYSVSGAGDLSYFHEDTIIRADDICEMLIKERDNEVAVEKG